MGFDEPQHISFAAQIKATGNPWPPLDSLRLIDPKTFVNSPVLWEEDFPVPEVLGHKYEPAL